MPHGTLMCPSERRWNTGATPEWGGSSKYFQSTHYIGNQSIIGSMKKGYKTGYVTKPSLAIFAGDTQWPENKHYYVGMFRFRHGGGKIDYRIPYASSYSSYTDYDAEVHGFANIVYMDNHVEPKKFRQLIKQGKKHWHCLQMHGLNVLQE